MTPLERQNQARLRFFAIALIIAGTLVAVVGLALPASAQPDPGRDYPAAHDNIVAENHENCWTIDQAIIRCSISGGPQWVYIGEGTGTHWLAVGTWTVDAPAARPWLVVRSLEQGRTMLVAPSVGGSAAILRDGDGLYTNHDVAAGTKTRREFRDDLEALTGIAS